METTPINSQQWLDNAQHMLDEAVNTYTATRNSDDVDTKQNALKNLIHWADAIKFWQEAVQHDKLTAESE